MYGDHVFILKRCICIVYNFQNGGQANKKEPPGLTLGWHKFKNLYEALGTQYFVLELPLISLNCTGFY